MLSLGGIVQRSIAEVILRVDAGTPRQKQLDAGKVAEFCRCYERRGSLTLRAVWVHTIIEKHRQGPLVTPLCCVQERISLLLVSRLPKYGQKKVAFTLRLRHACSVCTKHFYGKQNS